jgi:hypothetical protein
VVIKKENASRPASPAAFFISLLSVLGAVVVSPRRPGRSFRIVASVLKRAGRSTH